jgi:endonuclease/exonuclease/phosphatase (EEP) superfamily protein YafD
MPVVVLLLTVLLSGLAERPRLRPVRPVRPEVPSLCVETFNVNFARAGSPETLRALESSPADLVFLQETNRAWQADVQPRLAARYPHQLWVDRPHAGGQAVLSRQPLREHQILPSPVGWFPALRVVAETPLGPVQVLAVHLHPPITEDGSWIRGFFVSDGPRLTEVRRYMAALRPRPPALIVGDFNEGTDGLALRFLQEQGYRSALPEFSPDAPTWHWQVGGLELLLQLDHLLYDASLEPLRAEVVPQGRSDHWPVRASFVRAAPGSALAPLPPAPFLAVRLPRVRSAAPALVEPPKLRRGDPQSSGLLAH